MSKSLIRVEITSEQESIDILKFFIDACNKCKFKKAQMQQIIARGDKLQDGLTKLLTELAKLDCSGLN